MGNKFYNKILAVFVSIALNSMASLLIYSLFQVREINPYIVFIAIPFILLPTSLIIFFLTKRYSNFVSHLNLIFTLNIIIWLTLTFSTGGWSIFIWAYLGGIFFIIHLILILLAGIVSRIKNKKRYFHIDWRFFILTLLVLIPTVILNIGDCGDASGNYHFYQSIQSQNVCRDTTPIAGYSSITGIFYMMLFILFLFNTLGYIIPLNFTSKKGLKNFSIGVVILTILCLLFIFAFLIVL